MTDYRLVVRVRADFDIAEALEWYESQQPGLGVRFLDEIKATYGRIGVSPLGYQKLRGEIRRALIRRFPYGVYFVVEDSLIVVTAILHVRRDPSVWQRRGG